MVNDEFSKEAEAKYVKVSQGKFLIQQLQIIWEDGTNLLAERYDSYPKTILNIKDNLQQIKKYAFTS